MSDNLQPLHPALRQALQIANAMVPRTPDQSDVRQQFSNRIFDLMMRMREPEDDEDISGLDAEAENLKVEAITLAQKMPRPGIVLLFEDCIPLKDVEVITDGEWQISLNELDSFTIPSETPVKISSVARFMLVLVFPNGLTLRLRRDNFPVDGIPIKEFPSTESESPEAN